LLQLKKVDFFLGKRGGVRWGKSIFSERKAIVFSTIKEVTNVKSTFFEITIKEESSLFAE
jgi:hypothetical protein